MSNQTYVNRVQQPPEVTEGFLNSPVPQIIEGVVTDNGKVVQVPNKAYTQKVIEKLDSSSGFFNTVAPGAILTEELPDTVSPVQSQIEEDPEDSIGNIASASFDPTAALRGLLDRTLSESDLKFRRQVVQAFRHLGVDTIKFFPE